MPITLTTPRRVKVGRHAADFIDATKLHVNTILFNMKDRTVHTEYELRDSEGHTLQKRVVQLELTGKLNVKRLLSDVYDALKLDFAGMVKVEDVDQ